ncbi:MAG: AAA family ATPase [Treponema sp.]|nr:AAA family ATPase [Treponema sp.]
MKNKTAENIETLIRARYPLIYIVSFEEGRVINSVTEISKTRNKQLFQWSITEGLQTPDGSFLSEFKDPVKILEYIMQIDVNGLFILKDYHHYMNDPVVIRKLRDLSHSLKLTMKNVLFLSPLLKIPAELEKETAVVDYKLPEKTELSEIVKGIAQNIGGKNLEEIENADYLNKIVEAALGLTAEEAENVFAKSIVENGDFNLKTILAEKEQIIRKSGVLEYYHANEEMKEVGGLEELKRWLNKRGKAFSPKAREFGLPEPRGILLLGIPGCGKSLTAKAISSMWQLPLLKLDVGKVFSSLVGSSEENVRRAIATAESIAPCILWLDEMEKGFSGLSSSGQTDGGTTARVFGTFLTWLQEKKSPVFVVATCNNVKELPPELLRKGRFDEIFFVDLPSKDERKDIFKIHLEKRKRNPKDFNLDKLADMTKEFAGSEIEEIIISGLYDAFDQDVDLKQEFLENTIKTMVPLSKTMGDQIKNIREWAKIRARKASDTTWEDDNVGVRQLELNK